MFDANMVVPTRFLTAVAHLCIVLNLLLNVHMATDICLPETNTSEKLHHKQQVHLNIGLTASVGLIVFEMASFLFGVTMFNSTSALLSICGHGSATVLLTYFILDSWQCGWYWWIFVFCTFIPAVYDLCAVISTFWGKYL